MYIKYVLKLLFVKNLKYARVVLQPKAIIAYAIAHVREAKAGEAINELPSVLLAIGLAFASTLTQGNRC